VLVFLHSSVLFTLVLFSEALANNEEASEAIASGAEAWEAPELQKRKYERAQHLPGGTAVIKPPPCATGNSQGILFVHGFKTFTSPAPAESRQTYMWHCCATSDCTFQSPLGSNCLSHSGAHKHLKTEHDIVGQQPGTAAAKHNAAAARLVVEAEGTQIGAPRVKNLTIALLLITACLPFVLVESPHFRILTDVNISAQNARRFVAEIYLSIVETICGVIKKVVDTSMGLKLFWWNADRPRVFACEERYQGVQEYL